MYSFLLILKGNHEWDKNSIVSENVCFRIEQNFQRVAQVLDAYFGLDVKNLKTIKLESALVKIKEGARKTQSHNIV